jgi:V/A-type H+-transporting ATPase subunit D
MAKIKHTKNELKAQNEALSRYQRFLPMLQLKKQQLQAEIQTVDAQLEEKQQLFASTMDGLKTWSALFAEPIALDELVSLDDIQTESGNIAGVSIPILKSVLINRASLDLFETPTWLDDAQDALSTLIEMRTAIEVLEQQRVLIAEELRTTSQRVNLFEKVKIPECKEHIRIIKIFLGDEQTAAVARGKLAKKRSEKVES